MARTRKIHLDAGTYRLAVADKAIDEGNGLPSIIGDLTITGDGAETTVIERDPNLPFDQASLFRVFHVASTGALTLDQLSIQHGFAESFGGGGIFNAGGTLLITRSITKDNGCRN